MAKVSLASKFAHLVFGAAPAALAAPAAAAPAAGAVPGAEAPLDANDKDGPESAKPTQNEGESDEDFQERLKKWEDAQEDDEDAETEEKDEQAIAAARAEGFAAGGKRWEDVLASAESGGRVLTACTLLSNNPAMSAQSIIATLATCPRDSGKSTLAQRQRQEPAPPTPAPGAQPQAPAATGDAKWAADAMAAADQFRPKRAAAR